MTLVFYSHTLMRAPECKKCMKRPKFQNFQGGSPDPPTSSCLWPLKSAPLWRTVHSPPTTGFAATKILIENPDLS